MLRETIIPFIAVRIKWLMTKIFVTQFVFIDYWTLVHIWSGAFLMIFFLGTKRKHPWIYIFSILFGYEIIEVLFKVLALHLFLAELFIDQYTDIGVGLLGAFVVKLILTQKQQVKWKEQYFGREHLLTTILVCMSISYLWTGSYNFYTGYVIMTGYPINWFLLFVWSAFLFLFLEVFKRCKKKGWRFAKSVLTGYLAYFVVIGLVESVSNYIFNVNLISRSTDKAMFFVFFRGTFSYYLFYLFSPLISLLFYQVINHFKRNAINYLASKPK